MQPRAFQPSSSRFAAMVSVWTLGAWALGASSARAETYEIRPGDDLWARLSSLREGDEVVVHAGDYAQRARFEATWAGTEARPIVVRAAEGEARPVLSRDGSQNILNLHGSHFTLRGFELTGGSHGVRMSDVHHAVFEDLLVHDTGDVGISCNLGGMSCDHVTIRGSEIHHTQGTGEGMYLGCNGAACSFSDSIVERNYVHDLGGSQGDGIEIKQGSWGNVVRDNVVLRANYPGITLYSFEPMAGRTPNVIERNLVWGTMDNGIQVTGRAIVRNNVVGGAAASGIASQPNMDTPTDVQIVFNTVVGAGDACIRASSWDVGSGFVIANNAVYCEGARALRVVGASSAVVVGNVGLGAVEGVSGGFTTGAGLAADLGSMTTMARVYPPAGSALLDAADARERASDDFDGRARGGALDVGAYERDASGAPAWLAVEGFKVLEMVMSGADAGGAGLDAGRAAREDAAISAELDAGSRPDGLVRSGADATPAGPGVGGCRASSRRGAHRATALALAALALVSARRRRAR